MKSRFTLIELLVVIAIIAILAAVQAAGDHQTIRIDTGALPAGPTPFFELVADPR